MKTIKYLGMFLLGLVMLQSCQNNELTGGDQTAYLHLQGGFNNDNVSIDIDGVQVYHNDSVLTNNVLGLADVDSTIQPDGNHEIKVQVNANVNHIEHFDLHQTLWIGINLNSSDSTIHIDYSTVQFMYE